MKRKTTFRGCFLGILLLALLMPEVLAQLPGNYNQNNNIQEETTRLERYYEVQLKNSLSNYYNERSFLVDANVDLQEIMVPDRYRRSLEREEPVGLDQLPGLPILPEGFNRTVDEDTIRAENFSPALQIRQIIIRVVVDTSYTLDDIDFVEELVRSDANLDEVRGDDVTVEQKPFPRGKNDLAVTQESDEQPEPLPEEEEEEEPIEEEEAEEAGLFDLNNPELLRYIIYALAGFVLLLAIALFFSGRRSKKEVTRENTGGASTNDKAFDELKAEIQSLKQEEPEDETPEITPERRAQFDKDRSFITNQYISHPQKVADLLEKWITSDPDDGVLKAAKAIKGGNPKLLTTLRPVLKREHFDALQYCLEDMDPMPPHEQMEEARKFKKVLQDVSAGEEQDKTDNDMFGFVNQLSDDQLLHLFKDESDDMIAIVMAQLDGDRSADILKLLDEERRTSVLVKMGNINDLSIDAYKEVANYFSEKALKIINMKYVAADGVKSILDLIDTLPVDQQEEYVQSIAESDLKLAQKVRKYFVGFSDIPDVENQVLEEALNELETETLIYALIGADQEIYNKIMTFRPKREQQLIKSEIENRRDVDQQEVDNARKELLREIRNKNKTD